MLIKLHYNLTKRVLQTHGKNYTADKLFFFRLISPWDRHDTPLPVFFLRVMRCYKDMLASVYSNNSVHVWGSKEHRLLLTFLDLWIIKMPLATHSSCKLFLVLHLAPTSHFGRARSNHLRKVQIRCFLHKHLFFFSFSLPLSLSTPALTAPHFSKSACSIKTKPNKEL